MRLIALMAGLALCGATSTLAAPIKPELIAEVDSIFTDWRKSVNAPGLVYGIVQDGRLVAVKGQGVAELERGTPAGPDSLFRIASMSKAFTALAVLKLRDEGRLRLDEPAETYVPEMRGWTYPTADSPRITVRDLLNHAGGFVEDNPWGDRQQVLTPAEFTAILAQGVDFASAPRTGYEYSNTGYAILGRIVTNVSGRPYQDYIRDQLMRPLGMTSTGFDVLASPPARRAIGYRWQDEKWLREPDMKDGEFGAMGGVETSGNDYWRWVAFLLSAWPARDGPEAGPVKRSTVREIVTGSNFVRAANRNPAVSAESCRVATAYAMGWSVTDDCQLGRVVGHSGGYPGFGSYVALLPDKGLGLFAFSNRTYGPITAPVTKALLQLQESLELEPRAIPVSVGLSRAYAAAKAVWSQGRIEAAPLGNNVLMDRDSARWARLIADAKAIVGECATDAPIRPISAMEGSFTWTCAKGSLDGRVQRSPLKRMEIQALSFTPAG